MQIPVKTEAAASAVPVDSGGREHSFEQWCGQQVQRTEAVLERILPSADTLPARLHEAMRYAVLGGGKRVRPLLVYAAGEAAGASSAALDAAAAAVELIHAYSLVHDDMPCMDDDALRRGKPTVHVVYGDATAMLVGDALQALAFEAVCAALNAGAPAAAVVRMSAELAHAAGSLGMAGGQAIDLESVGHRLDLPSLEGMHRRKTGAMLRVSARLGALCAPQSAPDRLAALTRYGEAIGLAFQIVDDILDLEGDYATLGKTAGKDRANDKPTYVSLLGVAESRRRAAALLEDARSVLLPLGPGARRLRELAEFIVLRSS